MTSTVRNRIIAVVALLVGGGGLAWVATGSLGENLVYYWSPKELLSHGEKAIGPTIRLGGVVQEGSIEWNTSKTELKFKVGEGKDASAASVLVATQQIPPQMFREGIGVVVEGTYDRSGVFKTQRLMVNHSNEYRPPAPGETPEQHMEKVKRTVAGGGP